MNPAGREQLGFPFVPGTFPTVGVYGFMKRAGINTSWAEVDRLWDAYYLATVVEGIPPFNSQAGGKNAKPLLDYMEQQTQIPRNNIAGWLNALEAEVAANGRPYYLDPALSKKAAEGQIDISHPIESIKTITKGAGDAVAEFIKPSAEPLTNLVKWGAILVVGGAVAYGIFTATKMIRGRKGRRK